MQNEGWEAPSEISVLEMAAGSELEARGDPDDAACLRARGSCGASEVVAVGGPCGDGGLGADLGGPGVWCWDSDAARTVVRPSLPSCCRSRNARARKHHISDNVGTSNDRTELQRLR